MYCPQVTVQWTAEAANYALLPLDTDTNASNLKEITVTYSSGDYHATGAIFCAVGNGWKADDNINIWTSTQMTQKASFPVQIDLQSLQSSSNNYWVEGTNVSSTLGDMNAKSQKAILSFAILCSILTVDRAFIAHADSMNATSTSTVSATEAEPTQSMNPAILPRTVLESELTDKRTLTEDTLRKGVLGLFSDEATLKDLRVALNQPWTEGSLQFIFDRITRAASDKEGRSIAGMESYRSLACLLAYVSTTYSNNPSISVKAQNLFNEMNSGVLLGKGTRNALKSALEKYGNAKLVLMPSMWNKTNQQGCIAFLSAIEIHGNEEALSRLVTLFEKMQGQESSREEFVDYFKAVLVIYERLKHPADVTLASPDGRNSVRFDHAQELWFDDHHQKWTVESVLDTAKKDYPQSAPTSETK